MKVKMKNENKVLIVESCQDSPVLNKYGFPVTWCYHTRHTSIIGINSLSQGNPKTSNAEALRTISMNLLFLKE